MGLETGTYISDLNPANPGGTDPKSQGDDHLRLIKATLQNTFPNVAGEVTPSHTELNHVTGVTSPIQDQIDALDEDKASTDGATYTGTHDFTGATIEADEITAGPITAGAISGTTGTFSGLVTAETPDPGDNSNNLATTEFVQQAAFQSALPNQSGNAGKFLRTDGSDASWELALPDQTGNEGKFLTTDGSVPSWTNLNWTPLGSTTIATPVASVEFTGIPASAREVHVHCSLVSHSGGTDQPLNIQLQVGGVWGQSTPLCEAIASSTSYNGGAFAHLIGSSYAFVIPATAFNDDEPAPKSHALSGAVTGVRVVSNTTASVTLDAGTISASYR